MIRFSLFFAIAAFAFGAMDASAAEVKVVYKGVVTSSYGAHASSFQVGQTINVSYVLETSTADSNPDPHVGVYVNGLKEMRISVEGSGVDAVTGIGGAVAYNDLMNPDPSDQVSFTGYAASGSLAGLPINFVALYFGEYTYPGDIPLMITSDLIPTAPLFPLNSNAQFLTTAGWTGVRFLAEPADPAPTCNSEGFTGTKLTWCQNICEKGYTGSTLNMWLRRWIDRYRILPACAAPQAGN